MFYSLINQIIRAAKIISVSTNVIISLFAFCNLKKLGIVDEELGRLTKIEVNYLPMPSEQNL